MTKKIIGVGDLTIDILLPELERIPEWGQEQEIGEPNCRLGGNIGNMARAAATLSSDFICFAGIGKDSEGEYIRTQLQLLGLPEAGLHAFDSGRTSQTYAGVRKDGERFFLTHAGVLKQMEDLITEHPLPDGNIVFLSGWCLPPRVSKNILTDKICQWRREGRWIAADLIWSDDTWKIRDDLLYAARHVDALFMNEDELKVLANTDDIEKGIQIIKTLIPNDIVKNRLIIIKQGRRGACSLSGNEICTCYTPNAIKLKNTVGAGDVFNLAYLHAKWILNKDAQNSLKYACDFVPLFIEPGSSMLSN